MLTFTLALVISDFLDFRPGRYLFKPLAAAAFIYLALAMGATQTPYGNWLLAGLVLCFFGDVLLMADSDRFFLAGLSSFLLGHLLYCVAFFQLPLNLGAVSVSLLPVILLVVASLTWLKPHLAPKMKVGVTAYIIVIAAMLLSASMTYGYVHGALIVCGAVAFAISDLAVAAEQFVKSTKLNKLWGTPLYFISQMLLAVSVAPV
jgi:uncharacterized membrane protein YhhN